MGKRSRDKGKVGEREFAQCLRELGHDGARRGVQNRGGPDSPDVVGVPGLHFEVKRTETLSVYKALAQAERDAHTLGDSVLGARTRIPAVGHRRNKLPWLVIVQLGDLTEFCERWLRALGKLP